MGPTSRMSPVDQPTSGPAADDIGKYGAVVARDPQRRTMRRQYPRFRAEQECGADLYAGSAHRQCRDDSTRIANATRRYDRHLHGVNDLRQQGEQANLCCNVIAEGTYRDDRRLRFLARSPHRSRPFQGPSFGNRRRRNKLLCSPPLSGVSTKPASGKP